MYFFAKLNPTSGIFQNWRAHGLVSGLISDVLFRWDGISRTYVSRELAQEAVDLFRVRQDKAIVLEAIQILPQSLASLRKEPEPMPEPEVRHSTRRRLAE
jgi:hypothetical protein